MKTLTRILSLLFILCFIGGCAKQRPIELLKDPDNKRLEKTIFAGKDLNNPTTWFYKVTVTKTSHNRGFLWVGLQSDMKVGHFNFTEQELQLVDDSDIQGSRRKGRESNSQTDVSVKSWKVEHVDVKLEESDGKVTNRETEDDEKSYKEKRYVKVDFTSSDMQEIPYVDILKSEGCWSSKSPSFIPNSFDYSSDHITWEVGVEYRVPPTCNSSKKRDNKSDYTYTLHYRYSFRKMVESDYKPIAYNGE